MDFIFTTNLMDRFALPLFILCLCVGLAAAETAYAAHPYATDDAASLGAGVAEVLASSGGSVAAPRGAAMAIGFGLGLGVAAALDATLSSSYGVEANGGALTTQVLPPSFSLKWLALGKTALGSLGLRFDYRPPARLRPTWSEQAAGAVALATWQLSERVSLDANVGSYWHGEEHSPLWTGFLAFAVHVALPQSLSLGAEITGEGAQHGLHNLQAQGALIVGVGELRSISLGGGVGWHGAVPEWSGSVGYTLSFGHDS